MKTSIQILSVIFFIFIFSTITLFCQPADNSYLDISEFPSGVQGQAIEQLINTVNSNKPADIEQFIKNVCTPHFQNFAPINEHINIFQSVFQQTGGIDFHSVRTYVPPREETVIIVKDRNMGSWNGITFVFNEADKIDGLNFSPARTPTNVSVQPISSDNLINAIAEYVDRAEQKDLFSGTVLVAKYDKILYEKACGEASKRFHVPNNMDTKFNLGSMNKMFTATAIGKLVDLGKLSFGESSETYVDESWLPTDKTKKITIHHLLTHTSGLGSYFNKNYWNGSRELYRSVNDFKPLVQGDKLAFEPGSGYQYSNTGMLLLGVVIESISGQSYFDFIREHIYQPAKMNDSDSYEMDFPEENLAIGYIRSKDDRYEWENNLYKHVIKGGPAGGGFSTVRDLYRFALAMLENKLVSEITRDKMWTNHSDGYGYGFGIQEGPVGKVVGHGGGFPGLNGNLDIFVDQGYVVAVLSNYDQGAQPIASKINSLISQMEQ